MSGRSGERILYVAYGSNLCEERFRTYLEGGIPPGGTYLHPGARDHTPPRGAEAIRIRNGLRFVGVSRFWKGGVATITRLPDDKTDGALATAYDITLEQFEDLLCQENKATVGTPVDLPDLDDIRRKGSVRLDPFGELPNYTRVVHCGVEDGQHRLAISFGIQPKKLNRPSPPYLRTIGTGLAEGPHGLSLSEVVEYLSKIPGVIEAPNQYTREELVAALTPPPPIAEPT